MALVFARAILPMNVMTPADVSELTICAAHGVETIQVDKNLNRVNPAVPQPETGHCGLCTLVFGLTWAIVLTSSLTLLLMPASLGREDDWIALPDYAAGAPRAPPIYPGSI